VSQPWFPFWVGDYIRDTARLTTEAHGAYLLLILDYWAKGAPPDDNDTLASIARLSPDAWVKLRPKIVPFFCIVDGMWTHKRIEKELLSADAKHAKRVAAGKEGGKAKAKNKQSYSNASPKVGAMPYQSQPQSQLDGGGVEARATALGLVDDEPLPAPKGTSLISADAFTIADEVLAAMGKDPFDPIAVGAPLMVQSWLNGGWQRETIVAGVKLGMQSRNGDAPGSLKYFEKAIARAHAQLTAPVPKAVVQPGESFNVQAAGGRGRSESLSDVARRQAAAGINFGPRPTGLPADAADGGDAESGATVRLLPAI
jgi:uncharacterized protein YdaU (DUF1376 family)